MTPSVGCCFTNISTQCQLPTVKSTLVSVHLPRGYSPVQVNQLLPGNSGWLLKPSAPIYPVLNSLLAEMTICG
jgi:hypothetical protein